MAEAVPDVREVEGKLVIDGSSQPECFGIFWEAVDGACDLCGGSGKGDGDAVCQECRGTGRRGCLRCSFKHHCLDRFAETTLAKAQEVLGSSATPESLGEITQICPEAVLVAMAHQNTKREVKRAPASDPPVQKPAADPKQKKKPPKKKEAAAVKPPKKKRPPKAGPSVKRAAVPAKKKVAKKRAKPAKARAGARRNQSRDNMEERWQRERERSSAIAALPIGLRLKRPYNGAWYQCRVKQGYYLFEGKKYATLYMVTKEITGTRKAPKQRNTETGERAEGTRQLCNWSAAKFWRLKKVLADIEAGRR